MSFSSLVGDDLGKSLNWNGILKVKDVVTLKESFIDVKLKRFRRDLDILLIYFVILYKNFK